jgi:hypothetical protein
VVFSLGIINSGNTRIQDGTWTQKLKNVVVDVVALSRRKRTAVVT